MDLTFPLLQPVWFSGRYQPKPSTHLSLSYTPVILDMHLTGHSLLKLFYIKNNPIIYINILVYYITGNTS